MKHLLLILVLLASDALQSKAQYTTYGKIEFEKKTNLHAQMKDNDDDDNSWFEKMKSQIPQFGVSYFDLLFDSAKAIYRPGKEVESPTRMWNTPPATENIVLTEFGTKRVKAVKKVYEQKFLVQDTMRQMQWKVKDEVRTIAGFKCYKAVGRICDSVYVVAFYTEDIPANAGPEMFAGLPGMIMELAIPRLHTTWVATKVDIVLPKESDFAVADKGKKVNQKELFETVQTSLKDWGKWATKNIWWIVL